MSEDRIYSALMEINGKLGRLEEAQDNTDKKVDKIDSRLEAIEQKPAKRVEGGISTAINTFVAAAVAAVISIFTKGN
jgi:archaellum component FlaC